jgi:hypothetical protein
MDSTSCAYLRGAPAPMGAPPAANWSGKTLWPQQIRWSCACCAKPLHGYRWEFRVIFSTRHTQKAPSQGERVHGLMMKGTARGGAVRSGSARFVRPYCNTRIEQPLVVIGILHKLPVSLMVQTTAFLRQLCSRSFQTVG